LAARDHSRRGAAGASKKPEMPTDPFMPPETPATPAKSPAQAAVFNPLRDLHDRAAAEFQPYDRIEIVSTFGEPQAEYAAIHKAAALMDEPQRGVLELTGKDRHAFLNNLLTNQTFDKAAKAPLAQGRGVYAFFLNLKGRIVADMNVVERGDRTLLEMDARLVEPVRDVFDKYLFGERVTMSNRLGVLHRLTLHGPGAPAIITETSGADVSSLAPLGSVALTLFGVNAVVFRDDVTGSPGLHMVVPAERGAEVWQGLLARFGDSPDLGKRRLRPVGWAAFNATRIEAGRPLFGIDFEGVPPATAYPAKKQREQDPTAADAAPSPGVLPAETGQFSRAVSITKGCYLGQEIVARMHARNQVARRVTGLRLDDDSLPLAGAPVSDDKGNPVGVVTSSTISPLLARRAICLAFLKKAFAEPGAVVSVPAEGGMRKATVVELPFLPPRGVDKV
jgi:folate-binding protein YgfZ